MKVQANVGIFVFIRRSDAVFSLGLERSLNRIPAAFLTQRINETKAEFQYQDAELVDLTKNWAGKFTK